MRINRATNYSVTILYVCAGIYSIDKISIEMVEMVAAGVKNVSTQLKFLPHYPPDKFCPLSHGLANSKSSGLPSCLSTFSCFPGMGFMCMAAGAIHMKAANGTLHY